MLAIVGWTTVGCGILGEFWLQATMQPTNPNNNTPSAHLWKNRIGMTGLLWLKICRRSKLN
jgi:hypothetical protein